MAETGERRRRRRWRAALLLLATAGSAAGLVAHHRLALVERLLLWQLARHGISDASLAVTRVGLHELALRDLRIGRDDLALRALELRFSPAGLLARRIEAARIEQLRVRGRIDARGLDLGALDALVADRSGAAPELLPVLPVGSLEVDAADLRLETPHGPFEASIALVLDEAGRGRFTGTTGALATFDTPVGVAAAPFALAGDVSFGPKGFEALLEPADFSLTVATAGGPQPITGRTPRLALRGGSHGSLEIEGSAGRLALLGPGVAAEGIEFALRLDAASRLPEGSLAVGHLRDRSQHARFVPFALEATLSSPGGEVAIAGALRSEPPGVVVRFAGGLAGAGGGARVGWRLEPLRFTGEGTGPGQLVPALAAIVRSAAGEVDARGELTWGSGGLGGSADVALRDLTLETRAARIERVNAALHFDGPWPPRTPRSQLISMARVDFGLELTNGLVRCGLRRGGRIDLEQAEWRFAGGVVRTSGRFDPFAAKQQLEMTVDDVDLAELLALVHLEGLTGNGRLQGRLPLSVESGRIRILAAELHASDAGGWVRYRPSGRPHEALGAAGAALGDFLDALRDFRFEKLSLRVDGDPHGEVKVAVSLAGANPEHRQGQPYAFNLNVEGHLADLVRQGSAAYRVPAEIERRLEALSGGGS